MLGGMAALIGGVALTLFAIRHTSTAWLFAGIILAGSGFGAGFQGAIRTVIPLAGADQRAGVLSILYVIAYLSMGLARGARRHPRRPRRRLARHRARVRRRGHRAGGGRAGGYAAPRQGRHPPALVTAGNLVISPDGPPTERRPLHVQLIPIPS